MNNLEGMCYDRVAWTWVTKEEMERRTAEREERAFRRRLSQGQLAAPMIISDCQGGVRGIQSQANGKWYDSKSEMRKHYRQDGLIEVGNEPQRYPDKPKPDSKGNRDAVERAFAALEINERSLRRSRQ